MPELGSAVYKLKIVTKELRKGFEEAHAQHDKYDERVEESGKQLELFDGQLGKTGETATETGKKLDETGKSTDKLTESTRQGGKQQDIFKVKLAESKREAHQLDSHMSKLNHTINLGTTATGALGGAFALIKFPAIFAGAGMAAQAINGLAGGLVALGAALGPALTGPMLGFPGLIASIIAPIKVVTMATKKWGEVAKMTPEQLAKASPEIRALHDQLKPMNDELTKFKETLITGISGTALPRFKKAFETLMKSDFANIIQGFGKGAGRVVGNFAVDLSKTLSTPKMQSQMQKFSNVLLGNFSKLGDVFVVMIPAFTRLITLFQPFTQYLISLAQHFANFIDKWAQAKSTATGVGTFFDHMKEALGPLGHIFKNLGLALLEVGKAARPLGMEILKDLADQTDRLVDLTRSDKGQKGLAAYFHNAKPIIYETGRLIRDIFKVFFSFGKTDPKKSGLYTLLHGIRTELLPMFERVAKGTMKDFGPTLSKALINVGKLFLALGGSNGPLIVFVRTIGNLAGHLADILTHHSGLQSFAFTLGGMLGVMKAMKFAAWISGLKGMTSGIMAMRAQAVTATAATVAQTGATEGATVAQTGLNAAMRANLFGIIITALQILVAGFIVAYQHSEKFRDIVNGTWDVIKKVIKVTTDIIVTTIRVAFNVIKGIITTWIAAAKLEFNLFKSIVTGVFHALDVAVRAIWTGLKAAASFIWDGIKLAIMTPVNLIKSFLSTTWNAIKNTAETIWGSWDKKTGIAGVIHTVIDAIKGGIDRGVEAIGKVWSGIKAVFTTPINFVLGVINRFIRGINRITGILHIGQIPEIPKIPVEEHHTGGVVGAGKKRDLMRKPPKPGEEMAVLERGEVVLTREQAAALGMGGAYDKGPHAGGLFGRLWGGFKNVAGGLAGGLVSQFRNIAATIIEPIIHAGTSLLDSTFGGKGFAGEFVAGIGKGVGEAFLDFVKGAESAMPQVDISEIPGIGQGIAPSNVDKNSYNNLVSLGRALQAMGFQVGEHPAFGGVHPVHVNGSMHYAGRAIDVNHDQGQEAQYLDWLYRWIRAHVSPITELLWRTSGHYDHLHLGMARGGIVPGALLGDRGVAAHRREAVIPLESSAGRAALAQAIAEAGGNNAPVLHIENLHVRNDEDVDMLVQRVVARLGARR